MKIAISINTAWNIYNFRLGLVKALLREGHEVIAIAPKDDYTKFLEEVGCSLETLNVENTGSNPVKDIKLALTYYKIYKRVAPDIILQYTIKPNIYGTLAAKRLSIPVINNISGLGTVFLNHDVVSRIAKQLYKFAFKNVDLVFFQNADDKRDFLHQINIPEDRIELLPGSGINLDEFRPVKRAGSTSFTFLMISRIILDKGILEYVEAAKTIKSKNISFQLLGEIDENHKRGIMKTDLSSWQEEGAIKYLGSTDDVRAAIGQADCIVLPSYREGTPRTLLEGAAMSKPLVATNVAGCKHVVEDGVNGYLCEPKNVESLAKAMLKITSCSKEELEAFGANSRRIAEEKFDEQLVIEKYLKWILKLTNKQIVKAL